MLIIPFRNCRLFVAEVIAENRTAKEESGTGDAALGLEYCGKLSL